MQAKARKRRENRRVRNGGAQPLTYSEQVTPKLAPGSPLYGGARVPMHLVIPPIHSHTRLVRLVIRFIHSSPDSHNPPPPQLDTDPRVSHLQCPTVYSTCTPQRVCIYTSVER